MHYQRISVTAFEQQCTLLWSGQRAAIVDPGGDFERLREAIDTRQLTLETILLTHGHLDHVGAAAALRDHYAVDILGPHIDDAFWLEQLPQQGQMFGLGDFDSFAPTRWLAHGESLEVIGERLDVLHTPGHTPGHVAFYHANTQLLIGGDVLFSGGIGRTDFPGGSHAQLLHSIRTHFWPLDDAVRVLPGHGPETSIGQERAHNPFLQDE